MSHVFFSVMTCEAPANTAIATYSCQGQTTNWGDACTLDCNSYLGYEGDTQITCNKDNGDETADWDSSPTCSGLLVLTINLYT